MTEPSGLRARPALVLALCLLTGALVGLSGYSSESNHPTYLPPGLHLADPAYLAGDWWLSSARHYHVAFFRLVAALARLGLLEQGLALLNVAAVAAAVFGCYRIIRLVGAALPTACLTLVIALLLASYQFCTVGSAFLFTPSLQPSTIATTGTILAMVAFVGGRFGRCGLWLALAGAFHANFLVLNLAAFGLAFAVAAAIDLPRSRWRELVRPASIVDLARLLGPSLLVAAITLPLVLSIQAEQVSPAVAAEADRIFFRFAVPFHYYPRDWLLRFLPFLGLEALGLLGTARAVPDPQARRLVLALQLALGALIWSASALTTLVFIPAVSRLFVWRLAPFALLLAALVTVVGIVRVITSAPLRDEVPGDARRLRFSLYALPLLAVGGVPLAGQWLPTGPVQPALVIFAALYGLAALHGRRASGAPVRPAAVAAVAGAALVFAALTQPSPEPRYSLVVTTPAQRAEAELYAAVARTAPASAVFLIPPGLDYFRLRAGRAVVVDLKALPLNRAGIAEWYRRLGAISGNPAPSTPAEVVRGYDAMDRARLELLRCRYGVTHVVLRQPDSLVAPGWKETFHNGAFRVLAEARAEPCRP